MEEAISRIQTTFSELASSLYFLLEAKERPVARPGQEDADSRRILAEFHWNIRRFYKSCDVVQQMLDLARRTSNFDSILPQQEQNIVEGKALNRSGVGSNVDLEKLHVLLLQLQKV